METGKCESGGRLLLVLAATIFIAALSGAVGYRAGAVRTVPASIRSVTSTGDALRARLLTEAMDYVGVCSPEAAAEVWAEGLMRRSAAMQYAVMDEDLKEEYAKALEETAPNWVTGASSPWVSAYSIIRQEETGPNARVLTLDIETATSTGAAQTLRAVLTIEQRGEFWRITDIKADEALKAYTGLLAVEPYEAIPRGE